MVYGRSVVGRGFTIVELLIVIVVIAILASVTVVAYNGIQSQAQAAAIRSDLRQFGQQMERYKIENGTYPSSLTSDMGIKFTRDAYGEDGQARNARYCYNSSTDQFVMVSNSKAGEYFKYRSAVGAVEDQPTAIHGYSVCSQVGLTNTNPLSGYLNGTWASWVN